MATEIVFNKDYDSAGIFVMKVLDADIPTVWAHFSQAQLLDLWWAPKPWKCETLHLDFREGGSWTYAMIGPENDRQFAGATYHEINLNRSFDWTDYFTDENGNKDTRMPTVKWLFGFTGVEEGTKLTINIHFNSEEEMKQLVDMGFEQGFKQGLNQLEELLRQKDSRL